MKNTLFKIAALAALVGFTGSAFAAEGKKRGAKVDADGDGKVTQAEFVASVKDRMDEGKAKTAFSKRDKNGDGVLSADEMKPAEGKEGKGKKRKDANK